METIPKEITPSIRELAKELGTGEPVWVSVKPFAYAQPGRCYPNVAAYVEAFGGEAREGWLVWEDDCGRWLKAIHHAVWRSPDGRLLDITPHADGEQTIVFCPGGKVKWDGQHPVAGVYKPLLKVNWIRRLCEVAREYDLWMERNTTADECAKPDMRFLYLLHELRKLLLLAERNRKERRNEAD